MPAWKRDVVAAVVSFACVLALRLLAIGEPLLVLVLPIMISAYVGGLRTGIVATLVMAVGGAVWLLPPQGAAPVASSHDLAELLALVAAGSVASVLGEMNRSSLARALSSEHMYSMVFHASPVPLVLTDGTTGRHVDANEAYCQLVGWTHSELVGRTASERSIAAEPAGAVVGAELQRSGAVRDVPVRIAHKDGAVHDVLLSAVIVPIAEKPHALTTIVDVSAHKRAELDARESAQRLSELADAIDEVFWLADVSRPHVYYVSPAYERVFGLSRESLYAAPNAWLGAVHPDDRALVLQARAAGTHPAAHEVEFRIVRPDGEVRWLRNRSFKLRDASGAVTRIAGVAADITDRRQLEAELLQTQKMESLGRLAGGIAHDFNNVLAVIAMNASLLRELVPGPGEPGELVGEISHAVGRASGLTRQLLAFSRKQTVEATVLDVNAVIGDTRKMLRRMIGEDVELVTSLDPALAHVKIDPGLLVQVLMNLAVNARDAMPGGGTLSVTTRNAPEGAPYVTLAVQDTGCGMTEEVRARAFEPFFTTKSAGRGTGMGLSVVHGVVQQAGGRIEIQSCPGEGTTFLITLPATTAALDEHAEADAVIPHGTEHVLVVDDDPYVRAATARALRGVGYATLEAGDGATALAMLRDLPVDLLLTDVVMPGMNGSQLAHAARTARPDLKVLFTSGYTDDEVLERGGMRGDVQLLEKPFRTGRLATKVRAVLDQAAC